MAGFGLLSGAEYYHSPGVLTLTGEPLSGKAGSPVGRWARYGAAVVLLVFLVGALAFNQSIKRKAREGQKVPDWPRVTDLEGRKVTLDQFLDQPLIINITTTWCVSCKEEAPVLKAFYERYRDRVNLVGIDVRESAEIVKKYRDDFALSYPLLLDRSASLTGPYNVRGYPETWFVSTDGVARKYWEGPLTFEMMQSFYQLMAGREVDHPGVGPVAAGSRAYGLWVDPSGREVVLATGDGIFRRESGEWKKVGEGEVRALAWAAEEGTLYAASSSAGVLRSRDRGRSWEQAGFALPSPRVAALGVDAAGREFFVWLEGRGLFVSRDGGRSWEAVETGLSPAASVTGIAVSPADPALVFLSGEFTNPVFSSEGGFYLWSRDGGRSFSQRRIEEPNFGPRWPGRVDLRPVIYGVAFDSGRGAVYFATSRGIWRSGDGGSTARWLRGSHMRQMVALAVPGGGEVWALAPNGDLYRSSDGGESWSWSGDGGGSWRQVEGGGPAPATGEPRR